MSTSTFQYETNISIADDKECTVKVTYTGGKKKEVILEKAYQNHYAASQVIFSEINKHRKTLKLSAESDK